MHKLKVVGEESEIVTSESPMQLKIKLWQPKFLNWLPVGDLSFPKNRFQTTVSKKRVEKKTSVGEVVRRDLEDPIR